MKPAVALSTSSPRVTKEADIKVIVEFTKPVFGFEASMVEIRGGRLARQVHMVIPNSFCYHTHVIDYIRL